MKASHYSLIPEILIIFLFIALALLTWRLIDIWLLFFGSILVAIILRSIAIPIEKLTSVQPHLALAFAILLIIALILVAVFIAGNMIKGQINELAETIPAAWNKAREYINSSPVGAHINKSIKNIFSDSGVMGGISKAVISVINSMADLALVLVGGVYLAAKPRSYLVGMLNLVPAEYRVRVGTTIDYCGQALSLWLKGQLISMLIVGVLITIGLWIVGLPSALALGMLAGLGEFVPIVGTLFAAIPALLLASTDGIQTTLWTLFVYITVQQLQGNVIMPLIQEHMVYLPPALMLFALMALTILFGPLGLLFAAPLTVTLYVIVKKLYMHDVLKEKLQIPVKRRNKERN